MTGENTTESTTIAIYRVDQKVAPFCYRYLSLGFSLVRCIICAILVYSRVIIIE